MTPPGLVTVVRARLGQLDLLVPLFDAYRQFYKQPSDVVGARKFLRTRLQLRESIIFMAMRGREAVGFTQLYPCFSSDAMKRLWILNDLFVTPSARRHGVANKLMAAAQRHAMKTRAKGLILETAVTNTKAQRLYGQLKYKRDDAFYRYYLNV